MFVVFFGGANGDENSEFHLLMSRDKSTRPGCLLWHGWLPALAHLGRTSPWADSAKNVTLNRLDNAYGAYPQGYVSGDGGQPTVL